MKNVNLVGLYLSLVANHGVSGFELNTVEPENGEPIDMLVKFNTRHKASELDVEKLTQLVKANITGETKNTDVTVKDAVIQVYVEFLGGDASHWNN